MLYVKLFVGTYNNLHIFTSNNDILDVATNDSNISNFEVIPANDDFELEKLLSALIKPKKYFEGPIIPVLVIACNRISVRNCLDDLIRFRMNPYQFPIIVSQVRLHLLRSSSFSLFSKEIFTAELRIGTQILNHLYSFAAVLCRR